MSLLRLLLTLIFLAVIAASLYFSTELFLHSNGIAAIITSAFLFLSFSSAIFLLSAVYFFFRFFSLNRNISHPQSSQPVAVVVPSFNNDPEMVYTTLSTLKKLRYNGQLSFYLLDDSNDPSIQASLEKLCKQLSVRYIHRENREGFKGGALNNFLKICKEDFIAIFDADEKLTNPDFLMDTMGHFSDPKIAFVQTNKLSGRGNIFQNAVSTTNEIFFNIIQPVNAHNGFAIFLGSCGILRTAAIKEVGGFPNTLVEDAGISFLLNIHGWKGVHVSKNYAEGAAVADFFKFLSQQRRYIFGMLQLFPLYLSNIGSISLNRHLNYLVLLFGLQYVSLAQFLAAFLSLFLLFFPPSTSAFPAVFFYLFSNLFIVVVASMLIFRSALLGFFSYFLNFSIMTVRIITSISFILGKKEEYNTNNTAAQPILQGILGLLFLYFAVQLTLAGHVPYSLLLLWWALLFLSGLFFLVFSLKAASVSLLK